MQFCSKRLRVLIAGQTYVEVDIRSSHPTMLRTRLASVGKRIRLLDEWVQDREKCAARVAEEAAKETGGHRPAVAEVKELVLAAINGAGVEKWVREKWHAQQAPRLLAAFERDMRTVRASVDRWFPEVWKETEGAGSDWKRRARAVYFAMTSLEDEALEAMRLALPQHGLQCDALTGDGLLVRQAEMLATPLEAVLRALEVEVLSRTGVAVTLSAKTLDGGQAKRWAGQPGAQQDPSVGTHEHEHEHEPKNSRPRG